MAPFAIHTRKPRLERKRLTLPQALPEGATGERTIVGMDVAKPVVVERAEAAEITGEGGIDVADGPIRRHRPDELRQRIRKQPVARLSFRHWLLFFGGRLRRKWQTRREPADTIPTSQVKGGRGQTHKNSPRRLALEHASAHPRKRATLPRSEPNASSQMMPQVPEQGQGKDAAPQARLTISRARAPRRSYARSGCRRTNSLRAARSAKSTKASRARRAAARIRRDCCRFEPPDA